MRNVGIHIQILVTLAAVLVLISWNQSWAADKRSLVAEVQAELKKRGLRRRSN